MLEVRNLRFAYPERDEIIRGMSFAVEKGSRLGVVGRNGSGKTTLARLLCGLLTPTGGSVTVDGIRTADRDRVHEVRARVGIVFQDPDDQIVETTVEREVGFGPRNLGLEMDEVDARTEEALRIFGIGRLRRRPCSLLSGGEKQIVTVASVFAMRPDYIILDESTSLLDARSRAMLIDAVECLIGETGAGLVLISMRLEDLWICSRTFVLSDGVIGFQGGKAELLAHLAGQGVPLYGTPLLVSKAVDSIPGLADKLPDWAHLDADCLARSLVDLVTGRE
jgi:energy-coupling factor transport system ATP-binding protein